MNKEFSVKAGEFEGPFDALLAMIEKKKLHINEIALAGIADEFISYVRENEMKLKEVTIFVWTAATLMLIKSRSLLPEFTLSVEETEDVHELGERLALFAIFSAQAKKINDMFGKNVLFRAKANKRKVVKYRPDKNCNTSSLHAAIKEMLQSQEPVELIPKKSVEKQKSLKEVIASVLGRVKTYMKINFHELHSGGNKKETAVSFLAILELFKQGDVHLEQEEGFGKIVISNKSN